MDWHNLEYVYLVLLFFHSSQSLMFVRHGKEKCIFRYLGPEISDQSKNTQKGFTYIERNELGISVVRLTKAMLPSVLRRCLKRIIAVFFGRKKQQKEKQKKGTSSSLSMDPAHVQALLFSLSSRRKNLLDGLLLKILIIQNIFVQNQIKL